MNNKILLTISTILIVCAYFAWYYCEKNEHVNDNNEIINRKYQIELKKTKDKLEINNSNENVEVLLNGEQISSWTYIINN